MNYTTGDHPLPGFRLKTRLGSGGFGTVWKAEGPGGSEVAFKSICLAGACGDKELRAIRLVRRIRHPNIVPLTGFWLRDELGQLLETESDQPSTVDQGDTLAFPPQAVSQTTVCRPVELLVVMGLGDKTLHDRLLECQRQGERGIPPQELLPYLRDAARAIDFLNFNDHATASGPAAIQHGDIKPQNILIVGGSAQLCDLGLARMVDDARQTRAAFSPAYAAPECLSGHSPAAGTDQYSLAVTYVELRTGSLPFADATSNGLIIKAHLDNDLNLAELPLAEQHVIRRATSLRPEDRFPTTTAMVEALADAVAHPARFRPRWQWGPLTQRRMAAIAAGATTLLLLMAMIVLLAHEREPVLADVAEGQSDKITRREDQTGVWTRAELRSEHWVLPVVDSDVDAANRRVTFEAPHSTTASLNTSRPMAGSPPVKVAHPRWQHRVAAQRCVWRALRQMAQPPASRLIALVRQGREVVLAMARSAALEQISAGNLPEAETWYRVILAVAKEQPDSHVQLGRIAAQRNDTKAAVSHYRAALDSDPTHAEAARLLGIIFARAGNLSAALQYLSSSIESAPHPLTYRTRSLVYLQREEFQLALSDFRVMRASSPDVQLSLTLHVIEEQALVQSELSGPLRLAAGTSLQLLDVQNDRCRVTWLDGQNRNWGWIARDLVQPRTPFTNK